MEFRIGDKVKPIIDKRSRYYIEGCLDKMDYGIIVRGVVENIVYVNFVYKNGETREHNAYIDDRTGYIQEIEHYFTVEDLIDDLEKLEEKWRT